MEASLVIQIGLVAGWSAAGAVLCLRRGVVRLGLATLAGAGLGGAAVLGAEAAGSDATPSDAVAYLRAVALALVPAAGLHLLLAIPGGALRTAARRAIAAIGAAGALGVGVVLAAQRPELPVWPLIVEAVVAAIVGGAAVAARYRRADAAGRRRIKWLGWAAVVAAGIGLAALSLRALVSWPTHVGEIAAAASILLAFGLVAPQLSPLAGTIDRLLTHTISLAGLGAVVAAVYLVIVLGLGRVPTENERTLLVLSMAAAAVAALLYLPARSRLQQIAARLVYGERSAPDEIVRSFGTRMTRDVPMDELLLQLAESLRKMLVLHAAEIWTGSGGRLERSVSSPDRPRTLITLSSTEQPVVARAGISGPAWAKVWLPQLLAPDPEEHLRIAPIVHSAELLGLIVVRRGAGRPVFGPNEDRTLGDLARQVGLALHNLRLDTALQASLDELRTQAEALQASRARIVAVADAERRKIERNLHDGAQQHLVALAVKLRLARQLSEADPGQATAMLEELGTDIQATLEELRALAHGIYPPLLADRGLAEALRAAAARAPAPATVAANGLARYPPEMEGAIYFCCLEALQNIGKYAGDGARATVRVWEEAGGLLFEVSDDGAGFDVRGAGVGAGFTNMNDRVGAIGGTLRVESAPGRGTKVSGRIPLTAGR